MSQVAQFGQNPQSNFNSFDHRPSFDQRGGNGFDQRPPDTGFDQRSVGNTSGFDQRQMGGGFDQRMSGAFQQRSLNPQAFSGFDQRPHNLEAISAFDQRDNISNNMTRFNQFQSDDERRVNNRGSQEVDSRGSWSNAISQMQSSRLHMESDFSEYDSPSHSQQQWRGAEDSIGMDQRSHFGQERSNETQADQSGRHRNSNLDKYGGGNQSQQFMNSGEFPFSAERSSNKEANDAGDSDGANNGGSNLGPMFVIGQNNSKSSAPRRW